MQCSSCALVWPFMMLHLVEPRCVVQVELCLVLLLSALFKMPRLMWSGLFLKSQKCSLQHTGDPLSSPSVMFPFS